MSLTRASAETEQTLTKVPNMVCGLENLYTAVSRAAGLAAGDCRICTCAASAECAPLLPFCGVPFGQGCGWVTLSAAGPSAASTSVAATDSKAD